MLDHEIVAGLVYFKAYKIAKDFIDFIEQKEKNELAKITVQQSPFKEEKA